MKALRIYAGPAAPEHIAAHGLAPRVCVPSRVRQAAPGA